jgi:FAD/FMN-containing dehydrogenase
MEQFKRKLLEAGFSGELDDSLPTRELFSHDASLFEVVPRIVAFPKTSVDVEALVIAVNETKKDSHGRKLSLTARSGGTCMSGGSINDSILVDFKNFNHIGKVTGISAEVEPGVYYRDFEKATLDQGALLPTFPASREICKLGGMINNNSGGELSLRYGKTEKYVKELEVIFADGIKRLVKPLNHTELAAKMNQKDFEGDVYRKMHALVDHNYNKIKRAKPQVSKDSTGYHLWNIWDRDKDVFDLTQAIVGGQGTLGIVTKAKLKLVRQEPYSGVLVAFMKDLDNLGETINEVVAQKPTSFEAFDNYTLKLSIKFFFYFRKTLGWKKLIKLSLQLLPDALILARGIPKMTLLIEFTGETQAEVDRKIKVMHELLLDNGLQAIEEDSTVEKAWKFRIMRRESFNLLRKKVKDKHTAPFIDDLVVPPAKLVEFLPKLRQIINKYKLFATIAGHMGDGNFHVIPLMKIEDKKERAKLRPAMKEVNELVLSYGGSLSGEHNDGMIRGPWLDQMYGKEIVELFKETKNIFDPNNIFNPHKKTDASWDYSMRHIRDHF